MDRIVSTRHRLQYELMESHLVRDENHEVYSGSASISVWGDRPSLRSVDQGVDRVGPGFANGYL